MEYFFDKHRITYKNGLIKFLSIVLQKLFIIIFEKHQKDHFNLSLDDRMIKCYNYSFLNVF